MGSGKWQNVKKYSSTGRGRGRGVSCERIASLPGEVAVPLVTSCSINREELQGSKVLGLRPLPVI